MSKCPKVQPKQPPRETLFFVSSFHDFLFACKWLFSFVSLSPFWFIEELKGEKAVKFSRPMSSHEMKEIYSHNRPPIKCCRVKHLRKEIARHTQPVYNSNQFEHLITLYVLYTTKTKKKVSLCFTKRNTYFWMRQQKNFFF